MIRSCSGGLQLVDGGTVTGTVVSNGGTEYVYAGRAVTGTTVLSGGFEEAAGVPASDGPW